MTRIGRVVREAAAGYHRNAGPLLSGATAFYALLSALPLLVIALAMAAALFGADAARGEVVEQLSHPLGRDAASMVERVVLDASQLKSGWLATIVGVVVLIWAASRLFSQLHRALNQSFGVREVPGQDIRVVAARVLKRRIMSLLMVFMSGGALILLLAAKPVLAAIFVLFEPVLPSPWVLFATEFAASTLVLTVLIGVIYKVLPDVKLSWRDLWIGSLVTAVLLSGGSSAIGSYLGSAASVASFFGAAGSVMVVLLWAYYSAQIFFFGAELTRSWALTCGHGIEPQSNAVRLDSTRPVDVPEAA